MSYKISAKAKLKKPLEVTLGKASNVSEKEQDLSHLRRPIETSLFGLKQVLTLFETATDEVRHFIGYECDLMYECRICRTIFRSLANFILHKRKYCRDKFNPTDHTNCQNNCERNNYMVIAEEFINSEISDSANNGKKELNPVIEKLLDRQKNIQLAAKVLHEDLSVENALDNGENKKHENNVLLEKIPTSNVGIFQTPFPDGADLKTIGSMKTEVMEIHSIFDNNEAVLGPDGKICEFETNKLNKNQNAPKTNLVCTECDLKFSTKKTLTYHIKYKHNETRLLFTCPECRDTFANAWCVYRHLFKIHRKTSTQIRKLRNVIHNSVIRKDQEPIKKKQETPDNTSEENQWMDNFEEDNDLQMCGGCGKRFERKAALHSHSAMCLKRIAICNTIKENDAKKKDACDKNKNVEKNDKEVAVQENVGATKRKATVPVMCKPKEKEEVPPSEVKEACVEASVPSDVLNSNSTVLEETKTDTIEEVVDEVTNQVTNPIENKDVEEEKTASNDVFIKVDFGKEKPAIDSLFMSPKYDEEHFSDLDILKDIDKESMLNIIGIYRSPTRPSVATIAEVKCEDKSDEIIDKNLAINENNEVTEIIAIDLTDDVSNSFQETTLVPLDVDQSFVYSQPELLECVREDSNSRDNFTSEFTETKIDSSVATELETIKKDAALKRRRTKSLYVKSPDSKIARSETIDTLLDDDDVAFVMKATPYMDQDNLNCVSCGKTYESLTQLLWHMSTHFSWYRFQCGECSYLTFNRNDCSNHVFRIHNIFYDRHNEVIKTLPTWKTNLLATEFREFEKEESIFQHSSVDHEAEIVEITSKIININEDTIPESENRKELVGLKEEDLKVTIKRETCEEANGENNTSPCSKSSSQSSPELFLAKEAEGKALGVSIRPTRNRTKSVKTLQNDFIYDLNQVLKMNNKTGKAANLSRVKTVRDYSKNQISNK